jgi:hypothetical protein
LVMRPQILCAILVAETVLALLLREESVAQTQCIKLSRRDDSWQTWYAESTCSKNITLHYTDRGEVNPGRHVTFAPPCKTTQLVQTSLQEEIVFDVNYELPAGSGNCIQNKGSETKHRVPRQGEKQGSEAPPSNLQDRLKSAQKRLQGAGEQNQQSETEMRNADAEAEMRRAAAKQAEQQRERERTQQREAEARKWHCYGDVDSVAEGFDECQGSCRQFYNPRFCRQVCYASNEGSRATGRSCFKEP